jgi:hypothetical protein
LRFHFPNSISTLETSHKPIPSPRLLLTKISMLDYYKEFPSNKALYSRLWNHFIIYLKLETISLGYTTSIISKNLI